jgi:hypothetical protein
VLLELLAVVCKEPSNATVVCVDGAADRSVAATRWVAAYWRLCVIWRWQSCLPRGRAGAAKVIQLPARRAS